MICKVQEQVLLGTVLGGSSLMKPPKGRNYYLSMRSNNEKWLLYKMAEMPDLFPEPVIHRYGNSMRCVSRCCPFLTEMYAKIYDENNHRKITMNLLDPFMDIGLAVWYLDSGSKTGRGRKNAYLNTTKFGEDGTRVVHEYFNSLEMPCNVNRDGDRLKVLFTVDGTIKFLSTVAHCFPLFMEQRLS